MARHLRAARRARVRRVRLATLAAATGRGARVPGVLASWLASRARMARSAAAARRVAGAAAVTTGHPGVRVQVVRVLRKSHRYSCPRGDLNTQVSDPSQER